MDSSMLMEMAHSKQPLKTKRVAAVSDQFESVLVKQFLKEALKPMFKGVFNEDGGAHRMYRHFFTDAISESVLQAVAVLAFRLFFSNNFNTEVIFQPRSDLRIRNSKQMVQLAQNTHTQVLPLHGKICLLYFRDELQEYGGLVGLL